MNAGKLIGIVGGLGPYAGVDLVRKIFGQTRAASDQEHLPVALLSIPGKIPDRTSFLLSGKHDNPAYAITEIILALEKIGASAVGIPCVTAHAPKIFGTILRELEQAGSKLRPINIINEMSKFICTNYPHITRLGILGTIGAYQSGVFLNLIDQKKSKLVLPSQSLQNEVHDAIYNPKYGIKAQCNPINPIARDKLIKAIDQLGNLGAEAIVLGCTEIPLAITEKIIESRPTIDPVLILARALIREIDPKKLAPLDVG